MPSSESDDVVERPLGSPVDPWHRISDVVVLAIGFLFVFMTFTVLQTQASTILDPSVAFKSLGALYVSFAFFNLFAAAAIVERLGCGAALFVSSIGYTLFGAANVAALRLGDDVEAQIAILLPAAVLTGLSASVIWAAQGVYVTRCAASANVGKYTGIFFGVFWWASILGPLLTRVLLAASSDTFYVIAQLTAIGACGPLVLLWLWLARPEPSHPEALQVSTESLVEIPPIRYKFLRTFRIMFTRSMFFLAPLYYSTSVEQAFSGGSLPLFIKSDNPKVDLENKLYLQAIFGTTLMITSFIIGGITDRFGSRPLLVFDLFLHIGTMSIMWFLKPINNLSIIFPCAIALAVSDSLLMNQIYKLVGTLYPQKSETTTAFAAYKFHQSFATGFVFVSSKAMLGENGVPNMGIWTPLISVVLITATAGVFMATEKSVSARGEIVGNDSNERTPLLAGSTRISSSESEETPLLGNAPRFTDSPEELEEKRRNNRLGDVFTLATAFFFIFSAFATIQGLASSVLPKPVAFFTLGALYFSFAFCNLFLAAPIVDWIGCRPALFFAAITYSIFNINTVVALKSSESVVQTSILLPAALLNGLGASVLWAAESVYVTKCACKDTVGKYAGYFFAFVGLASLLGPFFSSFLIQLSFDKVQVFEILCFVGALGPLLILYIMWRPPPSNPYDIVTEPVTPATTTTPAARPVTTAVTNTNPMLKTFYTMISPTILLIAPISYFGSCQMAFNGGSIPLFIHTGNDAEDLKIKLYIVAIMGAVSTVTSACVGPFTDKYGPRIMLVFSVGLYTLTMGTMWVTRPENNLWVLLPCVVLFSLCSGVVANQNYKMMGVLFPGTASAFAAQRFHGSLGTGVAFMSSGLMLTQDGIPNMNIWAPLTWGFLIAGTIGSFIVTRDERFHRRS